MAWGGGLCPPSHKVAADSASGVDFELQTPAKF